MSDIKSDGPTPEERADCIANMAPCPALVDMHDRLASAEASLATVTRERDDLRLAILGGEDLPGVAATVPIAECIKYLAASRVEWQAFGEIEQARAEVLQKRVEELETALRPFGDAGYHGESAFGHHIRVSGVTVGDLRRARALAGQEGK